jgi:succinate dehydrogenase/fumarate reductase flavoprotein subunit
VTAVTVAGAGMAGLAAAARARELGAEVELLEKGTRSGGSMLLSSCVIWRYREWDDFQAECPGGDPVLQRLVWERLDDALDWLESLDVPVVIRETGNPRTTGRRFDPRGLTDALVRAAGDPRLGTPLSDGAELPLVLATGGFQGARELVRRFIQPGGDLLLRANPWSVGEGLAFAVECGAALSNGLDEFYGRVMPAPPARVTEDRFVELAQVYGRYALVLDEAGEEFAPDPVSWSEVDLVQAMARRPAACAWYVVDEPTLGLPVRGRTVADLIEAAREAGGTVVLPGDLPFELPDTYRYAVHVQAGITHTIGGLRIDGRARVLGPEGDPIEGVYAAGADAGGISTGGYASGLAAALVLGLVAAEEAAT